MTALEFQSHAEKMFPLVPHMGLKVQTFLPQTCVLTGTWSENKNHIGTVFGGSLYSFTALSSYGLIWAALTARGMMTQDIVISEGHIRYLSPVGGDFDVSCQADTSDQMEEFFQTLQKKGKARLPLTAEVIWNQKVCAVFQGTYVARREV